MTRPADLHRPGIASDSPRWTAAPAALVRSRAALAALAATLLALPLLSACGAEDDGPDHDPEACSTVLMPNRIGFAWEDLNHRISDWQITMEPDDVCVPTGVHTRIVGGDFTTGETPTGVRDDAMLRFAVQRVDTTPDVLGSSRLRITARIGPDGEISGTETLDRAALRLRHYRHVEALIAGFTYSTNVTDIDGYPDDYNPAHGYTSRGLGASVLVTSLTDDTVELEWRLRFEPGLSKDRANHNRAMQLAEIDASLEILLVGLPGQTSSSATVAYTLQYEQPPLFEDVFLDPAPEALQRVTLDGPSGTAAGLVGFRHFDLRLDVEDRTCRASRDCPAATTCLDTGECETSLGHPGFYVRELTTTVTPGDLDPDTGTLTALVDGYASNATQLIEFYALTHHFDAQVVRIPLPATVPVQRVDLDRQFPAGNDTFDLPGPESP